MRVVAFGEPMVEVSRQPDGAVSLGYGGDTFNTAVYLARLGCDVAFITAVGEDPFSREFRTRLKAEAINDAGVLCHPTRSIGLYAIHTDDAGERSFTYWRSESAARAFFSCHGAAQSLASAVDAALIYLSGITLAIFSPAERAEIIALVKRARDAGAIIAFDPNYRARLWSDAAEFRHWVTMLAPAISIALPGFDEERQVWGDAGAEATMARWRSLGVQDVVVKDGARGALTVDGWRKNGAAIIPVDTTGAGDSFNAAYLAARLNGRGIAESADLGAALAGLVVTHRGAIIEKEHMGAFLQAWRQ